MIDLLTLRPLDLDDARIRSASATSRVMLVEEGPRTGGWAGEVVAELAEACWGDLDQLWRLHRARRSRTLQPALEDAYLPGADAIVRSVLAHA